MADEKLKNDIKQSFDLNDDYTVQVDKYVNITDYMQHMDVTHYKVNQCKDKLGVLKDIYDVVFYNDNKIVENKRKGIVKNGTMFLKRNVTQQKHCNLYNFFFNLKLLSLT